MGGGYTLSTTILHYNFWKRRGSFLGLSECRGFIEVLYMSACELLGDVLYVTTLEVHAVSLINSWCTWKA